MQSMTSAPASHPMLKPISDIAAAHGFHLRITDDGFCVSPPRLPVTLNGQWLLDDAVFVYLYCRTTLGRNYRVSALTRTTGFRCYWLHS